MRAYRINVRYRYSDIDKNLRMEYQINNMAKTMQFNIENADSRLATFDLVLELVSLI